jgi:flavin reductase (DIM6/NTAB) family NADH-FMN oxidoreductase RutF
MSTSRMLEIPLSAAFFAKGYGTGRESTVLEILGSDPVTCADRVVRAMAAPIDADGLRALLGRHPAGVSVLTVSVAEQKLGLTIASLVSLSLDPPLVGFAVSREAAMHELLREAHGGALSLLAAGQEWLAQHFARGVPPIAMWSRIAVEEGATGAPLLVGALGWLECAIRDEVATGSHTFFVCDVRGVELGVAAPALVRVRGEYTSA